MPDVLLGQVRQALALSDFDAFEAQRQMAPVSRALHRPPTRPNQARQGAVLLLLYPGYTDLNLILIKRPDDLNAHAGQIAFPGGQRDSGETLEHTALRETEEEIGVPREAIQLLGSLSPIYIPVSDFEVQPFVGWHAGTPRFLPSPHEVAELIVSPFRGLLDPARREEELWRLHDADIVVPFYRIGDHKVWGATAIILGELLERLRLIV